MPCWRRRWLCCGCGNPGHAPHHQTHARPNHLATTTTTTAEVWSAERIERRARGMYPVIFGRPAPTAPAVRCDHGALSPLPRWTRSSASGGS